ncbi:hypothetical protein TFLX_04727 [Thermoflexales bacterium]|nr:hypothetical protein TFLX_04727 [Thermoflexales bacterium]
MLTGSAGWAASETCQTIVFRNDSGTAFTNIDALLPGACPGSAAWGDYDTDGDLDIVMAGDTIPSGYNSKVSQVYRNEGGGAFTDIEASLKDVYIGSATWGDYDRDNDLDISLTGLGSARIYRNGITTTNTVPAAPSGLGASPCSALSCNVTWSASSDDHTPTSGLTYNIRVGTTPGGGDIMSPMAITSTAVLTNAGYRLIPQMGNAGQMLGFEVRGLNPETTYYWSVQAVDTTYLGSPFSTEASFTTGSLSRVYLPAVIK